MMTIPLPKCSAVAVAVVALVFLNGPAAETAEPAVRVTIPPSSANAASAVAADFVGLSFEMEKLLPDAGGKHYFSPENEPLLATFRALGVKSLRVGGNTADRPGLPLPSRADIDSLFAFARAAGVKVIYTLRLREGSREDAASAAGYIAEHHAAELTCFAIGNEPNVFATEYPLYLAEWKRYVQAITAPGVAPAARFCGPSATPAKVGWARQLVADVADSLPLAIVTQHDYPGDSGRKVTDADAARRLMLSNTWTDAYQKFHDAFVPAAVAHHLPYRLEEANSFFHGGAKDVSDTQASALWALDYMYWWAAHGAAGVNFHNGDRVAAGDDNAPCRYASFWTSPGGYSVRPLGYALKAFDLGAHGQLVNAQVSPPASGVAAYAVLDADGALSLTLVRKSVDGADLSVRLDPGAGYERARVMFLRAPSDDASATTAVTLGGAAVADDATWKGAWTPLTAPWTVTLPRASAAIVRLER
jgi:hypothetical protein